MCLASDSQAKNKQEWNAVAKPCCLSRLGRWLIRFERLETGFERAVPGFIDFAVHDACTSSVTSLVLLFLDISVFSGSRKSFLAIHVKFLSQHSPLARHHSLAWKQQLEIPDVLQEAFVRTNGLQEQVRMD